MDGHEVAKIIKNSRNGGSKCYKECRNGSATHNKGDRNGSGPRGVGQIRRFMNQYFLLIACLQLWSLITPVNPASTWGPLIFIFAVSATKEAWDDYNRYLFDKKANEKEVWVVNRGVKKHLRPIKKIKQMSIFKLHADALRSLLDVLHVCFRFCAGALCLAVFICVQLGDHQDNGSSHTVVALFS